MTIRAAFEAYRIDVIQMKNQSRKTEENHLIVQRNLERFFGETMNVERITFPMIRDWKLHLDKTRSSETVRNYILKLRVVLRYLRSRGYNVLDPETIPIPQRNHKVPNFITSEEVTRLIAATSNLRNKAIVSLLYSSGIRVSELCALDRTDIHDDNTFTVVGKGGKARLCFIDKRTANLLSKYLTQRTDNNPSLFVGKYDTHRITSGNVQEIFRYLRKNSGIQCTPHTMRHSFATNLLRNNANMRYVQVMLGHESLQTTQMYSHVTDPDLQRIYAQYHTI